MLCLSYFRKYESTFESTFESIILSKVRKYEIKYESTFESTTYFRTKVRKYFRTSEERIYSFTRYM